MPIHPLTPEQEQVVHHPLDQHARVLAVAGSGKSTTMAHRIKHLALGHAVQPSSILVLMFNSLARKQFIAHLDQVGLASNLQPEVHTFHSFSFQLINQMVKTGNLPASTKFWLADKDELIWLLVKRAINNLEKARCLPLEAVDTEDALHTISLWKGSLIPPERAGSHTSPYLPLVYAEFEKLRKLESVLTFDDFIPLAVDFLQTRPRLQQQYNHSLRFLIIDEYQDINYGQQKLIELLAGAGADVMVVGDDDQTIYEWRGARPNYIIGDFAQVFHTKPLLDYRLSRSFRFGPLIAQCAANVIHCNETRVHKPLIASQSGKAGFIQIYSDGYGAIKELTDQVLALKDSDGVPVREIIVLSRLYAQLNNLEAEFLRRKIPYRVDGQEPFFKRAEIRTLLDYLRLANDYDSHLTNESEGWLLNVANKPSRMLSRSLLTQLVSTARFQRLSLRQVRNLAAHEHSLGLNGWQTERLLSLLDFLQNLQVSVKEAITTAGELLAWMVERLGYLDYFQNYYGKGEHAEEKRIVVLNFIQYVTQLRLKPLALLEHLKALDTTQGMPEEQQVVFTTIFRTKGLEYDYVFLPHCDENLLPYLKGEGADIFDKSHTVQECEMSNTLESERRLFYVALTRARKGVYIGTSTHPSRFLGEMQLTSTERVMSAVTWLAQGDASAGQTLLECLQTTDPDANLLHNLLEGYLPDLGQHALTTQLKQAWSIPNPAFGLTQISIR